jgi:hypothetical protein
MFNNASRTAGVSRVDLAVAPLRMARAFGYCNDCGFGLTPGMTGHDDQCEEPEAIAARAALVPQAPPSMVALVAPTETLRTVRPLTACCGDAKEFFCTCMIATKCASHGERHTGSHE